MNNYLFSKKTGRFHPSVVIIGANFAGLNAALSLPKEFSVTIVDPWPWFEFSPGIHELISGFKTPEMLRFSKETITNRYHHKILSEAATAILPEEKAVITTSGTRLPYDYCIMAVGGQSNTYHVKGADTHAMAFKSVDQCHLIAQRLEALTKKRKSVSIVIAGGGFEGIEALGEILRKYRGLKGIQIHLVGFILLNGTMNLPFIILIQIIKKRTDHFYEVFFSCFSRDRDSDLPDFDHPNIFRGRLTCIGNLQDLGWFPQGKQGKHH